MHQFLTQQISDRLKSALSSTDDSEPVDDPQTGPAASEATDNGIVIVTTEEEWRAWCFIRELLLTFSLSSTTCDSAWVSRGFSVIKHV